MKRQSALRVLISCLCDNDIAIFAGEGVCSEAYKYDRTGNFYMPGDYAGAFGVGIANGTSKRVFLFCEDAYIIRNFSEVAQIAASRCRNLLLVIIRSNAYQDTGFQPTLSINISGLKNSLFNLGFLVHNYTHHLKMNNPVKEIKAIWNGIRGPVAVFVDVEIGINKQVANVDIDYVTIRNRIVEFVRA